MSRLFRLAHIEPERHFVALDGHRVHVLAAGSGSPLLLLHGGSGGGANWYRVFAALSSRFRVLAPDLPGFGLSDPVPVRAPLGPEVARILLATMTALNATTVDVLGTSFGGIAGLRMAQRAPLVVRRLVLLDSVGLGRDMPWLLRAASLPLLRRSIRSPSRFSTRWLFRTLLVADAGVIPDADREALIEYLWVSAHVASDTLAAAMRLFADFGGQREVMSDAELRSWRTPTLLLWGERDAFLPVEHGRRAARLMPGATFQALPDSGHSPNWEQPGLVAEHVLSFLTSP